MQNFPALFDRTGRSVRSRSGFDAVLSCFVCVALTCLAPPGEASESQDLEVAVSRQLVDAARIVFDGVSGDLKPVERFTGRRQRDSMLRAFDSEERADWSYWPRPRTGLALADMDSRQRAATQELLSALLSSKGHLKLVHIMQLENVLNGLDKYGFRRSPGDYSLTLFGEPSLENRWSFRFEGHHISLNAAVILGEVRVTPSFLGASPGRVSSGVFGGFKVLRAEEELGRRLATSLTDLQKKRGLGADKAPGDIVSGQLGKEREAWETWRTALTHDGLEVRAMTNQQKLLLESILDEVLGSYRPPVAKAARSGLDFESLTFLWLGSLKQGEPHYYRIEGKSFVFEYDNVQEQANHIHTIWRERDSDFGQDLLREHYQNDH